jgi:hypothetical protein
MYVCNYTLPNLNTDPFLAPFFEPNQVRSNLSLLVLLAVHREPDTSPI